jgi:hypothetical protein
LELPALLGHLALLLVHFALPLHPFELLLAVEVSLSAAVFHFLLTLHEPLPGLNPVDNRSAR